MKKLKIFVFAAVVLVVGVALYLALQMGEKSPIFASGKIVVSENILAQAKGIRTLYIVVYDADSGMPMPYGAVREVIADEVDSAGIEFYITKEKLQVMNPSLPSPQRMRLKARLDLDGVAGMDQEGDLTGEVASVPFGAVDTVITIDRRVGSH